MQPMTIPEIISAVDGTWLNPRKGAAPVTAVCTDSRKIAPGCLFLPWVGERFDGHDFIDRALDAGAAGCLCARRPELLRPDKFYIQVADTRLALRALASAYRDRFAIPFVQVTGSVGKTTTKEMLAAVLGAKLRVLKTPENFNNDIGTPLTLLGLGPEHQAAVIETGMNHFGEIRYLGEMVRPDIAVISNIGDAHIEHLGSREGILKAKSEIFENLKPEGLAVLNGDDALLNTLDLPFRTVRCGRSEHCAVRVMDMADHGVAGITCTVVSPRDTYHLTIPAPGEHMAYSAAIAVAVGEELGLSTEEITRGAASYEPAGSRMRVLRLRDGRLVLDDCYNANPQSVTAALEILAKTEYPCNAKPIATPALPNTVINDVVSIPSSEQITMNTIKYPVILIIESTNFTTASSALVLPIIFLESLRNNFIIIFPIIKIITAFIIFITKLIILDENPSNNFESSETFSVLFSLTFSLISSPISVAKKKFILLSIFRLFHSNFPITLIIKKRLF